MKPTSGSRATLLVIALFTTIACAARTEGIQPDPPPSTDRIIPSELEDVTADNAYDIVQQLRPQWFRIRGPTSLLVPEGERPAVYVDNIRYGDFEVLHDFPLNEILEIRFINGPDATNRWGTGVVAGVIEVIRRVKR